MKLKTLKSYDNYVATQTTVNKQKLSHVWVTPKELRLVAACVRRHVSNPKFGLCHGVRNGFEVKGLRELLGFEIVGTEISDSATQFENVIQWDFHDVKDEWLNGVDFIYSNSWDHSYDPEMMIQRWLSCLTPDGVCILEWSRNHLPKSVYRADWFGIDLPDFLSMLRRQGVVEDVIRFNRVEWTQFPRQPLRWCKGLVLPLRLIVLRAKGQVS